MNSEKTITLLADSESEAWWIMKKHLMKNQLHTASTIIPPLEPHKSRIKCDNCGLSIYF